MNQEQAAWRSYQGRHPLNFELMCKRIIREAMQVTNGNRRDAAVILGVSRNTVSNWTRKYKLTEEFRALYGDHPLYPERGKELHID